MPPDGPTALALSTESSRHTHLTAPMFKCPGGFALDYVRGPFASKPAIGADALLTRLQMLVAWMRAEAHQVTLKQLIGLFPPESRRIGPSRSR